MDYPPRSRSQTRAYDHSPSDPRDDYFGPMERTHRSKSLDYRRNYEDDEFLERERMKGSQPQIPRRNYDYDRDFRLDFDSPRRDRDYFDRSISRREMARSQEFYPQQQQGRWQPPSPAQKQRGYPMPQGRGEYARQPGLSPKSQSSGKRLNVSTGSKREGGTRLFGFGRKKEDVSPRSAIYPPPTRDEPSMIRGEVGRDPRDPRYREGHDMQLAQIGGGGGGGYSRQHQSGYHYSSSGAAHAGGRGAKGGPLSITAQPMGPPAYKGPGGPMQPPRQHYRVNCCCFNFTWPPWSYEPTEPPQPMYRNI